MTQEQRDPELDLEPRHSSSTTFEELLVPMHADNFALALASGYIGGSLKNDAARDVQSSLGTAVVGFKSIVPGWAISDGEAGDRVILSLPREAGEPWGEGAPRVIDGPIRISSLSAAYFKDQASLTNFAASYDAFPDVAFDLVDKKVNWPVGGEVQRPDSLVLEPGHEQARLIDLDFLGGFAAGLLELLAGAEFDDALCQFLLAPGHGVGENARSLLLAMEPRSSNLDVAIWIAAVEALRARFGRRGFDRRDFLGDVEERLSGAGIEAESWVRGCQKVIDAEIDIPSLADNEKIGRRAALAIILSHEPSGLGDLEENLDAGARVRGLVTAVVRAFAGLSRAAGGLKSPVARMDAVLEVAERLLAGAPVQANFETSRVGSDLARRQAVKIAGKLAFEREVEPPAYMVMLKARIQEAGYKVELDTVSGRLGIRPVRAKGIFIVVEDSLHSAPGNPVVNLVLPVAKLGARPTVTSLKSFMATAWEFGTTVALRVAGKDEEVVAMASLPLATLDRDELNFHVERLLLVAENLGGKKKRGRRLKGEGT